MSCKCRPQGYRADIMKIWQDVPAISGWFCITTGHAGSPIIFNTFGCDDEC